MQTHIGVLREILDGLMKRYTERVPDVARITDAMIRQGIIQNKEEIENDHIAFRTLGVPNLGIASLEKLFLFYGYMRRDAYFFAEKKLNAFWYAPPAAGMPRIFISELRVKDLSEVAQKIIYSYTNSVQADPVNQLNLQDAGAVDIYLHSSSWKVPKFADYESLANESEYAAWAIYNRYYLNHFTMSIHNLKTGYNHLEKFNRFLEAKGIRLNDSGGKIKKSPDGLLLQSSTVAEMVMASFADGEEKLIPGSYVEFAERREIRPGELREGFEAANADKIFESTYLDQVTRSA